jgi:hypothetical protein
MGWWGPIDLRSRSPFILVVAIKYYIWKKEFTDE